MDPEHASVTARLAAAGCIAADEEATAILRAASGRGEIDRIVAGRERGEPLAWLLGRTSFCDRELSVEPGVYVPRPQTELIAARASRLLPEEGTAVDLCTGCGAVAVALAVARPRARVVATEIDRIAVRTARSNGVTVFEGDLDEPLPGGLEGDVDVLVAVVPYVPTDELALLPRDVVSYEPALALDGGRDGLRLLGPVVARAPRWLRPGGWLVLELGGRQAQALSPALRESGFGPAELIVDEDGDLRGIAARRTVNR